MSAVASFQWYKERGNTKKINSLKRGCLQTGNNATEQQKNINKYKLKTVRHTCQTSC